MEKIVEIPQGIEVDISNMKIAVKGEKGTLQKDFIHPMFAGKVRIEKKDNEVRIYSDSEKRKIKAMVGTIAAHLRNMIRGVTEGYVYKLKIVYMHFPFTVKLENDTVIVNNFLGSKSVRKAKIVGDAKVEIKGDEIIVTGINREEVGQTCGNLERSTKIKSRDRRIFQDGIFLQSKGDI